MQIECFSYNAIIGTSFYAINKKLINIQMSKSIVITLAGAVFSKRRTLCVLLYFLLLIAILNDLKKGRVANFGNTVPF